MRRFAFVSLLILGFGSGLVFWQLGVEEPRAAAANAATADAETDALPDHVIAQILPLSKNAFIARASDAVWRSDDRGASWRELPARHSESQTIAGLSFHDSQTGWAVLTDRKSLLFQTAITNDGGSSWQHHRVDLRSEDLREADLSRAELQLQDGQNGRLTIRLHSSSNFERGAVYATADGGRSWEFVESYHRKNTDSALSADAFAGKELLPKTEVPIDVAALGNEQIALTAEGRCEGFKTGCWQEFRVRLYQNGEAKEITPPAIKESALRQKQMAENETAAQIAPPGGSTRISLNRGFDKCTAGTVSQMQAWWDNSPLYDSNIYISGRNRGCAQPQLTQNWVNQVSGQGWGLIPTIVGYQSPCSVCTGCAKHSSDNATAETQGRGEADIAIADANALGLTQGTVLYYDMERYNDPGTGACSTPTKAFLKGWTDRVKELGYVSGVYGSPTNAVADWISIPEASRMDAVWMARWDNIPSVWTYAAPSPVFPENVWANHQRIKQFQAPHNETWGGVTFEIDGNIADGPVAGAAIPKNKVADFNGDGRSDISVFRPGTGVWYALFSGTNSSTAAGFGISTDVIAPGDYDGDGKADFAVFRPSEGIWYMLTRPAHFQAQQFGAAGDIPVPADYDGDGRTDVAVYRPSTGVWYIKNSFNSRGTSFTILAFGLPGDKPVQGDYDGDGKADVAVYRPSTGVWYLLQSTAGFTAFQFGIAEDRPAQNDFDGDGKYDATVFRPSTGVWYILRSGGGFSAAAFGLSEDRPVSGDYDGDNKADIAVFRPSTGVWYILQSTAGFTAAQFGLNGDKAVPAGYLPE